jgi:hypothetical protein
MGDSGAVGVSARRVGVLGGSSTKHHASGIWWHPTSSWWSWHQKNKLGWPTIEWPLLAKVRKKSLHLNDPNDLPASGTSKDGTDDVDLPTTTIKQRNPKKY